MYPDHSQPLIIVVTSSRALPSSPLITADKAQLGEGYFTQKAASRTVKNVTSFKQLWS